MAPFKAILSAMYVAIAGVVAALVRVIPLALGRSSCCTYLSTGLLFNKNCSSSAAEPAEKLSVQTVAAIFTAKAVAAAAMRVRTATTAVEIASPVTTVAVVAADLDLQQHSGGLHHTMKARA